MTTEIEWWEYDDAAEMADAVAGDIGFVIESAIDARGAAVIALAGGKTPLPIYERLAKAKLDWKRVTIVPGDERLVPLGDPLSNVTAIGKAFLPKGARVIPLVSATAPDYKAAGRAADAILQDLHWPLDLCLLGVGSDGHAASIFPGPDYDEALNGPRDRRALGVMPDPLPPEAPVARVSLSRAAIVASKAVMLAVTGQAKRDVIEAALKGGASSPYPIGRILADVELPIDIHWAP
jgi:6-phosphogluconolactonase